MGKAPAALTVLRRHGLLDSPTSLHFVVCMRPSRRSSGPCVGSREPSLASTGWYVYLAIVLLQSCNAVQGGRRNIHHSSIHAVEESWHRRKHPHLFAEATPSHKPGSLPRNFIVVPSAAELRRNDPGVTPRYAVETGTSQSGQKNDAAPVSAIVELLSSRRSTSPRPTPDAGSVRAGTRKFQRPVRPQGGSPAKVGSPSAFASKRAPPSTGTPRSTSAPPAHARPRLTVVRERRPVAAAAWPRQRPTGASSEFGVRSTTGALYPARPPHWSAVEAPVGVVRPSLVRLPPQGMRQGPYAPLRPLGATSASAASQASTSSTRSVTPTVRSPAATDITQAGEPPFLLSRSGEKQLPSSSWYLQGTEKWGELGGVSPVTRSELTLGQQFVINQLQPLRKKVRQTGDTKEALPYSGEEKDLSLLHVGPPSAAAAREDEKEAALKAALARLLPQEQLYTVMGINGEQMEARRGPFVRGAAGIIECIVVNIYTSTNYVGTFYDAEATSRPLSVHELRHLYTDAEERLLKEVAGNQKLLTKATADHLRSVCLNVFHGEYKLISRSPSNEEFGDSMVDEAYSIGATKALLVLTKFLLTPFVGPSIEVLWNSDFTEAALKFLVYRLVYTLSQLHGFGLAHRMLDGATVLIDNATGLPTLSHFASVAEFNTSEPCSYILLKTVPYASPEVALSVAEGESRCTVTEHEDSWSLGVILYMLLCRGRHPWRLDEVAAELGRTLKEEDAVQQFYRNYHNLVTREAFLGEECLHTGTPAAPLMSIIKLLIDPLRESRWTVRYLLENHPFFTVREDD